MNPFFRKIPTTAVPLFLPEIFRAMVASFSNVKAVERFEAQIARWLNVPEVVLLNKGTTALYLILKVLHELHPRKDEVVYPDYTVPTLKLAFDRAGLKTRVCDISRKTFNMHPPSLADAVNPRTLAVIPVHMFGFPMRLEEVKRIAGDGIMVIEDACQAPGAKIDGKLVGTFTPCSIFSLCKGKNITTYTGGFAAFQDVELGRLVRAERDKLPTSQAGLKMVLLLTAFALAMRAGVYGPLYPLIRHFKSEEVHQDFEAQKYTPLQSALGSIQLDKLEMVNAQRRSNGLFLYEAFEEWEHILIPEILPGTEPVFNHMPVVFLNDSHRERAQIRLWEKGIDTARMYLHPNHHIYDLGYSYDAFPEATLVAKGLITLPSHPYMTQRDLEIIIDVVRNP